MTADGRLVSFDLENPERSVTSVDVTGLVGGDTIVGFDIRPKDGKLYALSNQGRVYVIDPATGEAEAQNAGATLVLCAQPAGEACTATTRGADEDAFTLDAGVRDVDFNPAVDRMRVVSATQNLVINVDSVKVQASQNDVAIVPANANTPAIGGVAYTNNFVGTSSTVLFDIDAATDSLYTQVAAGDPTTIGNLALVGPLGVDVGNGAGFDITRGGSAHAVLEVSGTFGFYDVDLATGSVDRVGIFDLDSDIIGFAVDINGGTELDINGAVAEAIALTSTGKIVTFAPETPQVISSRKTITGLAANERLLGGDVRPLDGRFYALGTTGRIYTIDAETGVATAQKDGATDLSLRIDVDGTLAALDLAGDVRGLDFNPVVDRLRVIGANNNLVVNVDTLVAVRQNNVTIPGGGTAPRVEAAAYTNNFHGAVSTTLFDIDVANDALFTQVAAGEPATIGNLTRVGAAGLGFDVTSAIGFDIQQSDSTVARAILVVAGETALYTINLTTGAATRIAVVGAANVISYSQFLDGGIPAANTWGITEVAGATRVVNFNFDNSAVVRSIPARGLASGETIDGFDFSPTTDELIAVSSAKKLYVINTDDGTFTARGGVLDYEGDLTAFDINHTTTPVLLARIITNTDKNYTVAVADGSALTLRTTLTFTTEDFNVLPLVEEFDVNRGANPDLIGLAYDRVDASADTASTLFGVDRGTGDVVRLGGIDGNPSPNGGVLTTVFDANLSNVVDLDIGAGNELRALTNAGGTLGFVAFRAVSNGFSGSLSLTQTPPPGLLFFTTVE